MKQEAICAKCLQSVDRILALECNHSLCLVCAGRLLRRMQKAKSRLTNLECEVCGVISYLHPTAYEELLGVEPKKMTSRELSHKDLLHRPSEIPSERKPSSRLDLSNTDGPPMLFCFSCETVCFSVDDYINGLHRNHEVGNTSRQETVAALKQLLAEINEEVRKRIEVALRQSTKLTQRKRQLIEQLGRGKTSVRGAFEKLREELVQKEGEMLTELEACMAGKFEAVDEAIQNLKIFTEKCENAQDSIHCYQQAIIQADVVKGFNYYAEKKTSILEEIAEPIERVSDEAVTSASSLALGFDSLLVVSEHLKRAKLSVRDSQISAAKDNYFETIKQEIFNQQTKKEAVRPTRQLTASLARVRSAANLTATNGSIFEQKQTAKKPTRERQNLQSRLQEKIRGLEKMLDNKSRSPVRLFRRNILNL